MRGFLFNLLILSVCLVCAFLVVMLPCKTESFIVWNDGLLFIFRAFFSLVTAVLLLVMANYIYSFFSQKK